MRPLAGSPAKALRLAVTAATVGLAVGWFLILRPTSMGGPAGYVMVNGISMEPTYHTGDLVLTQREPSYEVGDIVQFRVKKGLLIHRIVGGNAATGFLTRGDNNSVNDGFRQTPETIEGKAWLLLPGVGKAIAIIRNPLPLAICVWGVAAFYFVRRWGTARPSPTASEPSPTPSEP